MNPIREVSRGVSTLSRKPNHMRWGTVFALAVTLTLGSAVATLLVIESDQLRNWQRWNPILTDLGY